MRPKSCTSGRFVLLRCSPSPVSFISLCRCRVVLHCTRSKSTRTRGGLVVSREWSVFLEIQTWIWLGGGLLVTLRIAAVVVAISLMTGTLLALMRLSRFRLLRWTAATYVDVMRATPVFLVIVFAFFGLPGL